MIPINSNVPAGSERGVAALLDLITNPKRAPEVKATLDELCAVRDQADEALAKANALNAENARRSKELDAQAATLARERALFDDAARALASAEAKHAREVSQFNTESTHTNTDLSARSVAVASAEQLVSMERKALEQREAALAPKELAAAALKTEYEKKLAELRKRIGDL